MAKPQMAPAVPTTHVKRMNNITPKMFWIHGKKHPISVPVGEREEKEVEKLNNKVFEIQIVASISERKKLLTARKTKR
jgi:hypothetical protein